MEDRYIAIVGCEYHIESSSIDVKDELYLYKEPENVFDDDAIKVCIKKKSKSLIHIGYVSNSVHTTPKGCLKTSRIYDRFEDGCQIEVMFRHNTNMIARIVKNNKKPS